MKFSGKFDNLKKTKSNSILSRKLSLNRRKIIKNRENMKNTISSSPSMDHSRSALENRTAQTVIDRDLV